MRCTGLAFVLSAVVFANCANPRPAEPHVMALGDRGARLYAKHCAACHGATGDADTEITSLMLPRPTAFRDGLFKLASTDNGIPTEEDLVRTLRRGMPGSTMMSFGHLPEEDLHLLAKQVMRLAVRGRAESIRSAAALGGRTFDEQALLAQAESQLRPGATVAIGERPTFDDATIEAGRALYHRHCASCHGPDGRGMPQMRSWPTDGTWLWPRDLTEGYLRGSADWRELSYRVLAGMPAAHMPPTPLSRDETTSLVAFLQGLIPEEARDDHVQWQRNLRVPRVDALPADSEVAKLEAVRLPVTPLWWRADAVDEVLLRTAHDGETLLWSLSWLDESRDDRALPGRAMGDGAAVQFVASDDPPLFAMGTAAQPVNIWRWHAFDPKETAGRTDLLADPTHRTLDVPGSAPPHARSESLQLHGAASAGAATTSGLPITTSTSWQDGRWTVTFRRSLGARGAREVDLSNGDALRFAVAIWDGRIDPHAGSKAISTWHALTLE